MSAAEAHSSHWQPAHELSARWSLVQQSSSASVPPRASSCSARVLAARVMECQQLQRSPRVRVARVPASVLPHLLRAAALITRPRPNTAHPLYPPWPAEAAQALKGKEQEHWQAAKAAGDQAREAGRAEVERRLDQARRRAAAGSLCCQWGRWRGLGGNKRGRRRHSGGAPPLIPPCPARCSLPALQVEESQLAGATTKTAKTSATATTTKTSASATKERSAGTGTASSAGAADASQAYGVHSGGCLGRPPGACLPHRLRATARRSARWCALQARAGSHLTHPPAPTCPLASRPHLPHHPCPHLPSRPTKQAPPPPTSSRPARTWERRPTRWVAGGGKPGGLGDGHDRRASVAGCAPVESAHPLPSPTLCFPHPLLPPPTPTRSTRRRATRPWLTISNARRPRAPATPVRSQRVAAPKAPGAGAGRAWGLGAACRQGAAAGDGCGSWCSGFDAPYHSPPQPSPNLPLIVAHLLQTCCALRAPTCRTAPRPEVWSSPELERAEAAAAAAADDDALSLGGSGRS